MKNALPDFLRDELSITTASKQLSAGELHQLTVLCFVRDVIERLQEIELLLLQSPIASGPPISELSELPVTLSLSERLAALRKSLMDQ